MTSRLPWQRARRAGWENRRGPRGAREGSGHGYRRPGLGRRLRGLRDGSGAPGTLPVRRAAGTGGATAGQSSSEGLRSVRDPRRSPRPQGLQDSLFPPGTRQCRGLGDGAAAPTVPPSRPDPAPGSIFGVDEIQRIVGANTRSSQPRSGVSVCHCARSIRPLRPLCRSSPPSRAGRTGRSGQEGEG